MLGHAIPSPDAARRLLYWFHEQDKIEEAKQCRAQGRIAYIPAESASLAGLGRVNHELVKELGRLCPKERIAAVDQDATMDPLSLAERSFAALPETVSTHFIRADSACHECNLVNWLRDKEWADGPRGPIGFAINARMSPVLHQATEKLPELG